MISMTHVQSFKGKIGLVSLSPIPGFLFLGFTECPNLSRIPSEVLRTSASILPVIARICSRIEIA